MARKKVIPLPSIPERSEKRTIQVSLQIETDNLELYRRAAYDSGRKFVSDVVRECIELGFPLYCKDHGIMPATPTKRILTDEEEEQRKELIEKRLRNLKYWKKKEDKGK
jgi:hypothetical protein